MLSHYFFFGKIQLVLSGFFTHYYFFTLYKVATLLNFGVVSRGYYANATSEGKPRRAACIFRSALTAQMWLTEAY